MSSCRNCHIHSPGSVFIRYNGGYLCEFCNDGVTHQFFPLNDMKAKYPLIHPYIPMNMYRGEYIDKYIRWNDIEHNLLDAINNMQDGDTKILYLNQYNREHKYRHIVHHIVKTYFNTIRVIFPNRRNVNISNLWHSFEYNNYIKYPKLSDEFWISTISIVSDYITTFETEEEVKIKLKNNYDKYDNIKKKMDNFISCFHQVVDDELSTEEKFANIFKFDENDIDKKKLFIYNIVGYINSHNVSCVHAHTFFDEPTFNHVTGKPVYVLKKDLNALSTIIKILKHYHELEDIARNVDTNIKTVNDIKKTNIFSEVCNYFDKY